MVRIDEKLEDYRNLILAMANRVLTMYKSAVECAKTGDVELALYIIHTDEFVNNNEFEINDKALEFLALLAPVASDLRLVLCGIKIVNDLERIGDYAKNVAQYVIKYGKLSEEILPFLDQIADVFFAMFEQTMEAYRKLDADLAFEIPELDKKIDETIMELYDFVDKQIDQLKARADLSQVMSVLRCFERAGDHTKNINEHIIYQVKGQHYDFG